MTDFQHPPISRHEALAPFSRDHYAGLVQAQHLSHAAEKGNDVQRRQAVADFVDAWDRDIAQHFADEERLLDALMNKADRSRLLEEHRRITELAQQARELRRQIDPDPQSLERIGQTLRKHIRWEERELFVRLQDQLSDDQLAALQRQTEVIEQARPRNIRRKAR